MTHPSHGSSPTAAIPIAPPLDAELERLLRRMRLPYIRKAAPEVLATAKAQRWDPVEVLKALLVEEVTGRDRSSLATRRARAAFPTGKTFDAWGPATVLDPGPHPAGAPHPRVGAPQGEPRGLRTRRHRQDLPPR